MDLEDDCKLPQVQENRNPSLPKEIYMALGTWYAAIDLANSCFFPIRKIIFLWNGQYQGLANFL